MTSPGKFSRFFTLHTGKFPDCKAIEFANDGRSYFITHEGNHHHVRQTLFTFVDAISNVARGDWIEITYEALFTIADTPTTTTEVVW